jgi:two-component system, NtrC family, sensor kinase
LDLRFVATVGNLLGLLIEREQLQIAARQRERLATIGEVMAGMAHGIKNIITGLRFSVTNLRLHLQQGAMEKAVECVDHVANQERRISELMLDMLSYAKERQPVRELVDVKSVLEGVVTPYRHDLETKGIHLGIEADPATPSAWAEAKSLQRVFLNLLTNAIDAIEAKGTSDTREIRITMGPGQGGAGVEIRFRDTGTGIPAAARAKVFDAFFSTKGSSGTGFGLAVSQKLVQEHGGRITVDSAEGAWTEFRVTLPIGAPERGPARPTGAGPIPEEEEAHT